MNQTGENKSDIISNVENISSSPNEKSSSNDNLSPKSTSYEKYNDKGLTGLSNLGNTCFVNACIQCLSHTYELNEFLDKNNGDYKRHIISKGKQDTLLLTEWDELRKLMWSENCTISPGRFINTIQKIAKIKKKELFTDWSQNDLPEFLVFLLDSFHTALSRQVTITINGKIKNKKDELASVCYEMMQKQYSKDYSEFLNTFFGIHVSVIKPFDEIKDDNNNSIYLSIRPEPYMIISLPVPTRSEINEIDKNKQVTLFDCFDIHCMSEELTGDNAWFNEKTGKKEDVKKQIIYWSLPNVMIIDLQRFTVSYNGTMKKNQISIEIPMNNVDFSKYVEGYDKEKYIYDLFAICNHSGSVYGGHYSAVIKNSNGKWYNFNDTEVKEVNITTESISGNVPYCLFYRKKKVIS